ncbi:MAG TPA: alpha/beta hydrolase, partial [Gaiellaceae bacterium]
GDARLWEPVARIVSERFRSIVYDRRFFGRSADTAEEWSEIDDAIGVLDRFGVETAAIVGLSGGGKTAIDLAVNHPDRVWAVGHVAGAVAGIGFDIDEPEGIDDPMELDLAIWAPLGADDTIRELWRATPDATGLGENAIELRPKPPAGQRLEEIAVPTLVIVTTHDPPSFVEAARTAARRISGARLVEFDSDHYLTLRRPQEIGELLVEFLAAAAPS